VDPAEVVQRYFRLINEEKLDEFFGLFDSNASLSAPFGYSGRGLEALKGYYLQVPQYYAEHVDEPVEILASGDRVSVRIEFRGRTRKGVPVQFRAADWFRVKDGKILSVEIFFDSYSLYKTVAGASGK
jgi:ketosteroid isomerase-like protein